MQKCCYCGIESEDVYLPEVTGESGQVYNYSPICRPETGCQKSYIWTLKDRLRGSLVSDVPFLLLGLTVIGFAHFMGLQLDDSFVAGYTTSEIWWYIEASFCGMMTVFPLLFKMFPIVYSPIILAIVSYNLLF